MQNYLLIFYAKGICLTKIFSKSFKSSEISKTNSETLISEKFMRG